MSTKIPKLEFVSIENTDFDFNIIDQNATIGQLVYMIDGEFTFTAEESWNYYRQYQLEQIAAKLKELNRDEQ